MFPYQENLAKRYFNSEIDYLSYLCAFFSLYHSNRFYERRATSFLYVSELDNQQPRLPYYSRKREIRFQQPKTAGHRGFKRTNWLPGNLHSIRGDSPSSPEIHRTLLRKTWMVRRLNSINRKKLTFKTKLVTTMIYNKKKRVFLHLIKSTLPSAILKISFLFNFSFFLHLLSFLYML